MSPTSKLLLGALALSGLGGALGCGGAAPLSLRPPPPLSELPAAPSVPEPESTRAGLAARGESQVTRAREAAQLRSRTIALSLEADSPEVRQRALRLLPGVLIGEGFTRVIYPEAVQEVEGELARDGQNGDRTTVRGTLMQLALLRASTPADHLLVIRVVHAGQAERRVPVSRTFSAADLDAYREAYEAFTRALQLQAARIQSYQRAVDTEMRAYEGRGGRYRRPAELAWRERVEAWRSQSTEWLSRARTQTSRTPDPARLQAEVEGQVIEQPVNAGIVRLQGILTDLSAGETFWMTDVSAEAPTIDAAFQTALERLLHDLGAP